MFMSIGYDLLMIILTTEKSYAGYNFFSFSIFPVQVLGFTLTENPASWA